LGDEVSTFHDGNWWRNPIAAGCENRIEIEVYETRPFEQPWQDGFDCGHEHGLDDRKFFSGGYRCLSFVAVAVRVK
jgi:hypothetical protein